MAGPISIDDLLLPQSASDTRETLVGALVTLGIPADQWIPGGALSVMLTVIATVYAMFTTLMAQAIASGFLEKASGGWLTLLAFYVYGVTRPAATFASGPLTLTNGGGGTFNYTPGQATFLDPVNGQTYTNETTIALGPLATQTITIVCTAAGKVGSAPPGEITGLVTQMLGVTVGNASSVVGQDAMNDANLRQFCLAKLAAMSVRGPRNAYAYAIAVAVNAVTGAPVNINRQSISRSSHTGTVSIVVASPTGVPDPNDVAGVVNSIEVGVPGLNPPFSGVRPDCVTVTVAGALAVAYNNTITIWAIAAPGIAGTSAAMAIGTEIADAITTYIADYPIGGVQTDVGTLPGFFASGLETFLAANTTVTIARVEGATDQTLNSNQVVTDGVTVAMRFVSVQ